ncbi:MAG: tetratricopeptide repeat protein [Myxococcota bacterium]
MSRLSLARPAWALAALVGAAGCPKAAAPSPAAPSSPPQGEKTAPAPSQRPPFPNMATAAWGSEVMEQLAKGATPGAGVKASIEAALRALHSLEPEAPTDLVTSSSSLFAAAESDQDRALGAALAAVGLVLDPRLEGYKERLTDAHGLGAYAATFEAGSAVDQAARAFVAVSAGRVFEGQKLIDIMSTSSRIDPDSALLLALARTTAGQRSDELFVQLERVLADKPESSRARWLYGSALIDVGFPHEALRVIDADVGGVAAASAFDGLRVRAHAKTGDFTRAQALVSSSSVPFVQRGEGLFALAIAANEVDDLGQATKATQSLAAVPGFEREHGIAKTLLSLKGDDASSAANALLKSCQARGLPFSLALECLWWTTEACVITGDDACATGTGKKAVGADGDVARLARARAKAAARPNAAGDAGTDSTMPDDDLELWREAHLLSPFDVSLGSRLGLPSVEGGAQMAQLVRGARRAIALGAPRLASRVLDEGSRNAAPCRVCRAVLAFAASDSEEAARRAAAAVLGSGVALGQTDLIALLDVLGGSGSEEARKAVAALSNDARPLVREAWALAKRDQDNPEGRTKRKAEEAKAPPRAGSVPVPGTGLGAHRDHEAH